MEQTSWEKHYTRERAELRYPDENLVRLLRKNLLPAGSNHPLLAIDLGCGSGRHLRLLEDLGVPLIAGLDSSYNALALSCGSSSARLIQGENTRLPFRDESADIAVAWGSLHYAAKDDLPIMLSEISRTLVVGGHLFATLRSSRDTFLKKGIHLGNDTWRTDINDLRGSIASFFDEDELKVAFSIFGYFRYGLMERTLIGDTAARISHWIIHARKQTKGASIQR